MGLHSALIKAFGIFPAGVAMVNVAAVHLGETINVVAVIVGGVVILAAGFFTIRSNIAKIWRTNFEGEKLRCDQLTRENHDLAEAKAVLKAQLDSAIAKTDLTTLMTTMGTQHLELITVVKELVVNAKTSLESEAALREHSHAHTAALEGISKILLQVYEQTKPKEVVA